VTVGIDVSAAVSVELSGVGIHIIRLLDALDSLVDPDLCLRAFFPASSRSDIQRARERLPFSRRIRLTPVPFIKTSSYKLHRLYMAVWLPSLVKISGCDVFHGPAHQIPSLRGLPTVVTVHDLAFLRFRLYEPSFARSLERTVKSSVAAASAVIAVSHHTRREIAALLHRERDVRVIYGAGDYASAAQRAPQPADRQRLGEFGITRDYVLYVGDFGARKNIPYLIESYAALRRAEHGLDVQLVLAGNSVDTRDSLQALAGRVGLAAGDVVFPGRVSASDLAILYRNARAFALCSLAEGFGQVTLEAMSYGVPVVATRTSSLEEVNAGAAEFVPLDDTGAVAAGLRIALTAGPRRDEMRTLGFAKLRDFTWAAAAHQTLRLYRDLASRKAGGRVT
jgi:glycosyltransferase involved in cell wall biosynthesis